ncbi:MAG TPA: PLDc N-terminal domain-containing protein, partial [Ktedonobacteraceae bacterium]
MTFHWGTIIAILTFVGWLIPFILLFIVPANRKPSSATAWLLLAFFLPYVGVLIFLLLGSPKLSPRRLAQQRTMDDLISKSVAEANAKPELRALFHPPIPLHYEPFICLNENLGRLPALGGNHVELLSVYASVFERLAAEIDCAQHFVHLEYFTVSR